MIVSQVAISEEVRIPKSQVKDVKDSKTFYLISIGIAEYDDKFWPDLKWTTQDATRVSKELGVDNGYQRKVVTLLNREASFENIKEKLKLVTEEASPQDIVAVYVSAHGSLIRTKSSELEPVIVLSNTKIGEIKTASLRQRQLREWVSAIGARKKLLILATCHSGVGKSKLPVEVQDLLASSKGRIPPLESVSEGAIVLAASAMGETAAENNSLKSDVYSYYFLEALRVYDRDHDGRVTALEAHDYAKEKTFSFSNGRQRPTAEVTMIGDADIVLRGTRQRTPEPILEAYDKRFSGFDVDVNGTGKGSLPLAFPLKSGRNIVRIFPEDETEALGSYTLNANTGDVVTLDEVLAPQPFSIDAALNFFNWKDRRFVKLAGSRQMFHYNLSAGWQWRSFKTSLLYSPPLVLKNTVWSGLKSQISNSYYLLNGAYVWSWPFGFGLRTGLLVGLDDFKIKLKDTETGGTYSEQDSEVFYGAQIGTEYTAWQALAFGLSVEYHLLKHDFGYLGSLDGTRTILNFDVIYKFGGRARKL